jgi:hypothetical protein
MLVPPLFVTGAVNGLKRCIQVDAKTLGTLPFRSEAQLIEG